jgi:poly(3-hydroxyoctanoate) depolymerase
MAHRALGCLALVCALLTACQDESGAFGPADQDDMAQDMAGAPDSAPDLDAPDLSPDDMRGVDMAQDAAPDLAQDLPPAPPRCEQVDDTISCTYETQVLIGNATEGAREVHWQIPTGQAPAGGWPAVLLFQGSLYSAELSWEASAGDAYGAEHQTQLIARLLDNGFAVLTPETHLDGSTYWDTNVSPWNYAWTTSPDHELMLAIFAAIDEGTFGPLNGQQLYAAGISSGGYMASRVGITYTDRIRAIAIESASYATCSGALCLVPTLDASHPPTLLLHGGLDFVVPEWTMHLYESALESASVEHRVVVDPLADHAWIAAAPEEVTAWFMQR